MSFESDIKSFSDALEASLTEVFKSVVIAVGDSVITLSPVLTGRFKGNWQMGIDFEPNSSLINYDSDGNPTLSKIIAQANNLSIGQVAYIVNNLDYGYEIEVGGWPSGKPPYSPVGITELKFAEIVKSAVDMNKI